MRKSSDGRFEYQDKDGDELPAGTSLDDVGRFAFSCRSASGQCAVNLGKNAGYQIEQRNWHLTGSIDKPTISPSINCHDCWHGYIKNGIFLTTSGEREPEQ